LELIGSHVANHMFLGTNSFGDIQAYTLFHMHLYLLLKVWVKRGSADVSVGKM